MSELDYSYSLSIANIGQEILTFGVWVVGYFLIFLLIYLAWKLTGRRSLDYEVFLVEMHTLENRRVVEVLHLSNVFRATESYSRLISGVRARVQNRQGSDGNWLRVSDTNVVIRSPGTVGRSETPQRPNHQMFHEDPLTLYEIDLPPTDIISNGDQAHDTQVAAAAAIAVLGRGDGAEQRVSVQAIEARTELDFSDLQNVNMNLLVPSRSGVIRLPRVRVSASLFTRENAPPVTVDSVITTGTIEEAEQIDQNESELEISFSLGEDGSSVPDISNEDEAGEEESNNSQTTVPIGEENTSEVVGTEPNTQTQPSVQPSLAESVNVATEEQHNQPNMEELVKIRLKFLDDSFKDITTSLQATIAQFVQSNFSAAISDNKIVRLIFQGNLLRDDVRTLESYGAHDGCIIHCNISDTPFARRNLQNQSMRQNDSSSQNQQIPNAYHASNSTRQSNVTLARAFYDLYLNRFSTVPPSLIIWMHNSLRDIEPTIRPSGRNTFLARQYESFYNRHLLPIMPQDLTDSGPSPVFWSQNARFCIGDYLILIFGVQCALIWAYVYFFPQLCDRTAIGLLVLLTLYFVFVVLRNSGTQSEGNRRS